MINLPLPSSWAPVSKLSYKPWLNEKDKDEVFFGSIQLFAGTFNKLLKIFLFIISIIISQINNF